MATAGKGLLKSATQNLIRFQSTGSSRHSEVIGRPEVPAGKLTFGAATFQWMRQGVM